MRGIAQLLLAGAALLATTDSTAPIVRAAAFLKHHVVGAWSLWLADKLMALNTRHRLWLVAVALGLDGILEIAEGWALLRRRWWGPWLIVAFTTALLPIELLEVARHLSIGRVLTILTNSVIVLYLVRLARRRPEGPA